MIKIINFFKKYSVFITIGVLVLFGFGYFIFGSGNGDTETFTVTKTDVKQSVILSGRMQTSDRADLGFAASGRVTSIFAKNNQIVKKGTFLAQLEINSLLADLKIKQANLRSSMVSLDSAKEELNRVQGQEDTKVESAYRKLISTDLVLTPSQSNSIVTAPTVTGIYDGPEGQYKISIDKQNFTLEDVRMLTFGLESTSIILNKESSSRLGSRGLYISFPSNTLSLYEDTIWYLDIPNKSSSSYLANYNTYNEARKNRDSAVQTAQAKYDKILSEGNGGATTVAQAEVEKINAEIRKNTIYAPFSGKVTNIEKKVGENASIGERVISILSESKLEVVLQVSELDVSRLIPGANVIVKLDALPGEVFEGKIKTINSRDTEIDGVPVYEAFVEVTADPRIKTGMTATGDINIATKSSVLAVPSYFIKKIGGKSFVTLVSPKGKTSEQEVTTGLLGTDSMLEIISGLNEGDKITGVKK